MKELAITGLKDSINGAASILEDRIDLLYIRTPP